jgi:hypothetical protein
LQLWINLFNNISITFFNFSAFACVFEFEAVAAVEVEGKINTDIAKMKMVESTSTRKFQDDTLNLEGRPLAHI